MIRLEIKQLEAWCQHFADIKSWDGVLENIVNVGSASVIFDNIPGVQSNVLPKQLNGPRIPQSHRKDVSGMY